MSRPPLLTRRGVSTFKNRHSPAESMRAFLFLNSFARECSICACYCDFALHGVALDRTGVDERKAASSERKLEFGVLHIAGHLDRISVNLALAGDLAFCVLL